LAQVEQRSIDGVLINLGEPAPTGTPGFSEGIPTVTRDAWRNRFYADVLAKETNFHRASGKLIEAGHVGAMGDRVWLP
jgi:hypothetical protein